MGYYRPQLFFQAGLIAKTAASVQQKEGNKSFNKEK